MYDCNCNRFTYTGYHTRECPAWNATESKALSRKRQDQVRERNLTLSKPFCSICFTNHDYGTPCFNNTTGVQNHG